MTENKPGKFPPLFFPLKYIEATVHTESLDGDIKYIPEIEVQAMVRAAKRDAYLQEVTFWIGEHRAYVETGMMWEAELAMKNSRRYGDLAERENGK